ncbi:MAG TPA: DUF1460 domain-containing protein [Smithellaceae bacterium]|nr:DUF1460 domain-containing protein [Smithellaceae bacterium]
MHSMKLQELKDAGLNTGELIVRIGANFLKTPYLAETSNSKSPEKLTVNFSHFDCFTFMETTLALAQSTKEGDFSWKGFTERLRFIRYRQGIIDGYSSRLHYFIDWLRDGEKKGILRDLSRKFGGVPLQKKISYMTTHRTDYSNLQDQSEFKKIAAIEAGLSKKTLHIIPAGRVNLYEGKITDGDIIAFATKVEGLDVGHVGFALWKKEKLHLLHASRKTGSVVISAKNLEKYLNENKKFTGIIIARPL